MQGVGSIIGEIEMCPKCDADLTGWEGDFCPYCYCHLDEQDFYEHDPKDRPDPWKHWGDLVRR